jgi:hypothetical protein
MAADASGLLGPDGRELPSAAKREREALAAATREIAAIYTAFTGTSLAGPGGRRFAQQLLAVLDRLIEEHGQERGNAIWIRAQLADHTA